ncbi:extracellular triacylglycerol lipase, putative [Talaromyces stipitatus ATCC 10500]|uniref:Extracellular triacylglycerol lipase, putative n=1 Tax=Talaromyces stipitatus (strain ATCC 10500 / CBS 375.48 / QM 6759 / NRRL 1006) TaxID=441959 RepID=B8M7F3_TALSN|nr:extracellular triacylglycerol lipase, putative [Talaromyces stipitatus ATCC 10500]EED20373.1 extracellular triacylglycerol lipase, putative [Talaromyces stipitatus ATCC 10500]
MTQFIYLLLRCYAVVVIATTLLADAAAVQSDAQHALQQQRNKHNITDRIVSAALFAELEESARLADIAYCIGTTGIHNPFGCLSHCDEFKGFELITTWNTGPLLSDSCGYIALSHPPSTKRIIVAFRGTYSLTNTIIDLSAVPQEYVPYPADGDNDNNHGMASLTETRKCKNCTVHAGFWTSWKNSRDTVLSAVTQARLKYPDYEVRLIGHSLGGAVAALAGLEMDSRGLDPQVTTFGEPRVGNDKMADFTNEMFGLSSSSFSQAEDGDEDDIYMRYRRVTHMNDPVPLLPLTEWGYTPHAGEIYISKLDLPPSREDVEHCIGNADNRCISSSEAEKEENVILASITQEQQVLSSSPASQRPSDSILPSSGHDQPLPEEGKEEEMKAQWSLVPTRYRIWELFFAHRDYFWRIGLCVPGGDPTSWRWL